MSLPEYTHFQHTSTGMMSANIDDIPHGLSIVTNPYFNSCPIGQSLFRSPVPAQTITPTQPEPAYYTLRTLCTVFDDWRAAEFPVSFSGEKQFQTFTFRRGEDEFMVAAWIPGYPSDGIAERHPARFLLLKESERGNCRLGHWDFETQCG